jgi:hypothetical protein
MAEDGQVHRPSLDENRAAHRAVDVSGGGEGRMPARKSVAIAPDRLRRYERLIASIEGLDSKSNFGSLYTAVNGNMSTMISKHGVIGIRLPANERAAFIERYETELFRGDPAWPPAKEFVAVPDRLLDDPDALRPHLELAASYTRSLKPKPTRR